MTSAELGHDPKPGPDTTSVRPGPVARPLVFGVNVYRRWISPFLPPSCRFYPSCSAYAVQALTVHGALRGTWLTVRRLLKCGPWHPGGLDPVPPRRHRLDERQHDPGHHAVLHRDRVHQTPAEE
ncbi:MAG TPA: membrane protein insertion efficiency factor YidD [Pseudonocardiaceae bacterium]|nr:membrane protein insertion efficiency factor YidD [Pseudonocardiaceae bacterium]